VLFRSFRKDIDLIAARHAAERATDADKEILSRIHDALCLAVEQNDSDKVIRYDTEFHIAVVAAAHNIVLLHSMRSILQQMVPLFYHRLPREPDKAMMNDIVVQHGDILQAIIDHDPDAAKKAVETHGEFVEASLRNADYAYWREHTAQKRLEMLSKGKRKGQRTRQNGSSAPSPGQDRQ